MKRKFLSKNQLKKQIDSYFEAGEEVKTPAGLAVYLGIDRAAFEKLAAEEGSTGNLLRFAKTRMEKEIVENGLKGKLNATMSSFILKTTFGYRDKPEETAALTDPLKVEVSDELKKYAV